MTPEALITLSYAGKHPLEAAQQLERLSLDEMLAVLAPLPPPVLAGVMEYLLPQQTMQLLRRLSAEQATEVVRQLPAAAAIGALRHMPADEREPLLARLPAELRERLRQALAYPEDTAGSLADPFVFTLPAHVTVGEGLERLRAEAGSATYYLYVLDAGQLAGVTSIKRLLIGDAAAPVAAVSEAGVVHLPAAMGLDGLLQTPYWRQFHILPVVGRAGEFVGALRLRQLRRIEAERQLVAEPTGLSDALIQLWQLYAMAGIGMMTHVADAIAAGLTIPEANRPRTDRGDDQP